MSEDQRSKNLFGAKQAQFLAFVLCFAGTLILGCLLAFVIYLLNQAFSLFSGVIWSLALSGMLAILLRPVVTFLEDKWHMGRLLSILTLYLLVLATAFSTIWFIGGKVIHQTQDFIGTASEWPDRLEEQVKHRLPAETWESISGEFQSLKKYWQDAIISTGRIENLDLNETEQTIYASLSPRQREEFRQLEDIERYEFFSLKDSVNRDLFLDQKNLELKNQTMESIEKNSGQIAEKSAEVIKSAWVGLMEIFTKMTYIAVIPIYLFYFLSSNRNLLDDLDKELIFLSSSVREDVIFLIREFVSILVAFFRGQLLIGLLMGIGYAIGFSMSGLKFGITLGLLFGLLNVIPYLGSVVGVILTFLIAYLQPEGIAESGQWGLLLGCTLTFIVVQLIESYYLTPKIMGQQTGLHPVVVIVSIFFWGTALGGILGMIFGIPLTAFIIIAWRLICRKYLNRSLC